MTKRIILSCLLGVLALMFSGTVYGAKTPTLKELKALQKLAQQKYDACNTKKVELEAKLEKLTTQRAGYSKGSKQWQAITGTMGQTMKDIEFNTKCMAAYEGKIKKIRKRILAGNYTPDESKDDGNKIILLEQVAPPVKGLKPGGK